MSDIRFTVYVDDIVMDSGEMEDWRLFHAMRYASRESDKKVILQIVDNGDFYHIHL